MQTFSGQRFVRRVPAPSKVNLSPTLCWLLHPCESTTSKTIVLSSKAGAFERTSSFLGFSRNAFISSSVYPRRVFITFHLTAFHAVSRIPILPSRSGSIVHSRIIGPTIRPPTITSITETKTQRHAMKYGIGRTEKLPYPIGIPVPMPNNKPYARPVELPFREKYRE